MDTQQTSLFDKEQPLADRIRPSGLDDFVGQDHLRPRIKALMSAKRLSSLLLFGPPGCGKSTLALIMARSQRRPYLRVSAPEAGLQKLRKSLPGKDILVLDELHRFSKAQQDFFLPLLESGEVTLLASTTENPSFCVTPQLLSRMHVLRLRPLKEEELALIAARGVAEMGIEMEAESLKLLASMSGGDGRTLLNLVEYAVQLAPAKRTPDKLQESLPEFVIRHDKKGDNHYELASALIKSIRGSDPDAALYWLGCLLEGGEDPRFITRRLILSASEDVGLADPYALTLAVSCQQAVEFVGMPEGFIPLAETVTYLALAHKSNTSYAAYRAVQQEIKRNGPKGVPLHLRNPANKLMKEWGFGKGYQYPHNFEEHWVDQDYLPPELSEKTFFRPGEEGMERRLTSWWHRLRKRRKHEPQISEPRDRTEPESGD